jgi:hypothetical protein
MNRFNRIHVREFKILELITWDSLITYVHLITCKWAKNIIHLSTGNSNMG